MSNPSKQYLALYRAYRPKSFADVIGQEHLVALLTGALEQNKIAHAYLFYGGRGTGKTSVARILAKELKCNSEDIIEIDAASNRGIDEIRELRESVRTAPFSSPYKVYIIDEAHMLTKEASNALLKTLEEPPSHVIFILATTDPEKLPQTIVSRCQKIEFKKPELKTLAAHLVNISQKENKTLSEESALLIAQHGKGSYRDALGTLEQVLSQTQNGKVDDELVATFLGVPEKEIILETMDSICRQDSKAVITSIRSAEISGVDPYIFYDRLTEYFRLALLARAGDMSSLVNEDKETQARLIKLANDYPAIINSKSILVLLNGYDVLYVPAINKWLPVEAIILSLVNL